MVIPEAFSADSLAWNFWKQSFMLTMTTFLKYLSMVELSFLQKQRG